MGRSVPHTAIRTLVGKNTKRLLRGHKISRVAAELKMSAETIYRTMDGVRGPSIDTIGRLSDYLGCEPAEFFAPQTHSRKREE